MRARRFFARSLLVAATALPQACAAPAPEDQAASGDITSNDGNILEFNFAGEVLAAKATDARQAIVTQLQYVQGILTTRAKANGQVGLVGLSEVRETVEGGKKRIAYKASLPVVWPKDGTSSERFELPLPLDTTVLDAFNEKYDGSCGKDSYGQDTFWHDFNPEAENCKLDGADVHRAQVTIRLHPKSTEGKFPEYDQVWADNALNVVAVFGLISGDSENDSDDGAREMENFLSTASEGLAQASRTKESSTSSIVRRETLTGTVALAGKTGNVSIKAFLVGSVFGTGSEFDDLFGAATENADLIVYSGHSGLGKNINALAEKMRVSKNKYQLVYLNGCQSFAYLGTAMRDKHVQVNGAETDPNGTKFLDVVANALPAYDDNGASSLTLYDALLAGTDSPKSFNELLTDFSSTHLVAVFGEEDNTYRPTPER